MPGSTLGLAANWVDLGNDGEAVAKPADRPRRAIPGLGIEGDPEGARCLGGRRIEVAAGPLVASAARILKPP